MKKMYKNARSIWTWIVWQVKVAKSEKVEALFMLKDLFFFFFSMKTNALVDTEEKKI